MYAAIPFCCIYGYQAPEGTVHFSEKVATSQEKDRQQQQHASDQDRQIIIHYLQLKKPDLSADTTENEVRIIFESREELLSFSQQAVSLGAFPKPRRVLLLVNPKGGTGQAKDISDTIVKPMFKHSGHQLTEQYTEYAKHAIDIAKHLDIETTDTLATISGDGVLHELINGLLQRPDWDKVRRRISLALISAGSGNAIATSIGTRDRRVAALALIRGRTAKTDVFAMAQRNRPRIYSLLMFTWGMMADSDLESDRYRWLGGLRFEIAGFMRIFRLRRYPGKVYVYPPKGEASSSSDRVDDPTQQSTLRERPTEIDGHATVTLTSTDTKVMNDSVGTLSTPSSSSQPPMKHEHLLQQAHAFKQDPKAGSPPPPPPSPWRLLPNMPFYTMFLLLRQPYVNETLLFSHDIRMNDGLMWVWYSCETRFWRIVKPFVMDQNNGQLIKSGLLEHTKAGALLIEPGVQGVVEDPTTHQVVVVAADQSPVHAREAQKVYMRPGFFDVDGEAIYTTRTLIEVLPSLLEIVVPEWFDGSAAAAAAVDVPDPTGDGGAAATTTTPKTWKQFVLDASKVVAVPDVPTPLISRREFIFTCILGLVLGVIVILWTDISTNLNSIRFK
ncbi:hypothetical protein DFQ27_009967 [Actinomortierella ambigua]|uniref:DAGKc domain-containing protein n=1 Tax=Actinomortierella ambigua TaxID=1343610 RepID=A0A9P6UA29_9FUNG|nr:hypothetical protein DFQ27_009967 [Actinomortierella ambigua]